MPTNDSLGWLLGMIVWVAFYFAGSWALWGKTIGKAVMGLRIVQRDGGGSSPDGPCCERSSSRSAS